MQYLKKITFDFTDYSVIYTPLPKEKFGDTHFRAQVIHGNLIVSSWKVTHFPNKTNALKLINTKK